MPELQSRQVTMNEVENADSFSKHLKEKHNNTLIQFVSVVPEFKIRRTRRVHTKILAPRASRHVWHVI